MRKRLMLLISLFIVSLVSFSSATYAWFSEQLHPEVGSLIFNVATQENIMISTSGNKGTFKDVINFEELYSNDITLKPLKGIVEENSISLVNDGGFAVNQNGNYIKFSLYFSSSTNMDVYLNGSDSGTVIDIVRNNTSIFDDSDINKIVDCVRIGFLIYSTNEVPNSSGGFDIVYDPLETLVYSDNVKDITSYKNSNKTYDTFTKADIGFENDPSRDIVLFSTEANNVYKMDVFIWIESEDVNCDVSVFDARLQINLRFFGNQISEGGASEE